MNVLFTLRLDLVCVDSVVLASFSYFLSLLMIISMFAANFLFRHFEFFFILPSEAC